MIYPIFSCSCRPNGNSDFCAQLAHKNLPESTINFISTDNIQHCIACGYCDSHLGQCAYTIVEDDIVYTYYKQLFSVQHALFIVPIYFYHVPAPFKAFLDRAQAWHLIKKENKPATNLHIKTILLGGREKGEKLFEGSYLSIKYAMQAIGASVEEPLCLYGLDKPTDLSQSQEKQNAILQYILK